ncbi:HAD-like protein [Bimuria novae-zelandiae CBS 107.79]|uniref:HAD-like protein n=1 Tax=Bimuria novae-zelandiae CBS 107.79 TaxID=1447943 RepID=A0A6A5V036_9PLEO|nr:HAD-like protein [Bimuria novae-zelandiae CBS 107.79]
MSKLTAFKLLACDVYGTLIDYERGLLASLQPSLQKASKTEIDPKRILQTCGSIFGEAQKENSRQKYSELLAACHPKILKELGLSEPAPEESRAFGASVGTWPAYEDSVSALRRLKKTFKMVVLSNVDNESFKANNANSLDSFEWDLVLTAEDIGSYKPDHRNFEYMFKEVKEKLGVERHEVLQTAQSQLHDHHPAKELGLKSAWIYRPGQIMGNRNDPVYTWKFDQLEDMANQVDKELKPAGTE